MAGGEFKILKTKNLTKSFGGLIAVNSVNLEIKENEVFALIGPNGAGKTTFVNTVVGVYEANEGKIFLRSEDITSLSSVDVTHEGIARTFQSVRYFPDLSVIKNVMIGAIFGNKKRLSNSEAEEKALEMLDLANFKDSPKKPASDFNSVQLKKVELARALATDCKVLMLDEIAAGLTPKEIEELIVTLKEIKNKKGITLFVIEHLMKFIMGIADRIGVLDFGELIAVGSPSEISNNEKVKEAYLG